MLALSRRSIVPAVVAALALAGCHTIVSHEETARGETRRERRAGPPRPLPARLELAPDGRFRILEPLVCGADSVTDLDVTRVARRTPNAATLIVGVVATAAGVVALVSGASADEPGGSPLTYVGPVAIAGGLPLVIGPLIGNRTDRTLVETRQVRAPGEDERCGERPVAAVRATLMWSGLRAVGAVDADGWLAVSPFAFVDAFAIADAPPMAITVEVELLGGGQLVVEAVIDQAALAKAQVGFLAGAGLDATAPPIRKVPRLEPEPFTLYRTGAAGARVLELVLPIRNTGPGAAFAVRVILSSPNPELDGRVIYAGQIAAHGDRRLAATLPISDLADRALATGELTLSGRLRDAYDAAPETPIRFQGRVPAR